jgi:cell division protein FtsZ
VMVLGQAEEPVPVLNLKETVQEDQPRELKERELQPMQEDTAQSVQEDHLMPRLVEELPVAQAPVIDFTDMKEEEPAIIHFELGPVIKDAEKIRSSITGETAGITTVSKMSTVVNDEGINSAALPKVIGSVPQKIKETDAELIVSMKDSNPVSAASGGYLARPSNIYAESQAEEITSMRSAEKPVPAPVSASNEEEELLDLQMQLVERDDIPAADMPLAHQAQSLLSSEVEDSALQDETEEQKRRAAERLHKLRNLSFNVNAADPNNEFETVPAYIRRNMELYNHNTQVENFYSNYEVKTDDKNQSHISSINTFLDGKKPD